MDKGRVEGERETKEGSGIWQPNEQFVNSLVEMGISRSMAEKALFNTGNVSADLAAAWVLERSDADSLEEGRVDVEESGYNVYKMVFIVNSDLQMGIGKLAAQVAHATLGIHKLLLQREEKYGEMVIEWESSGETKIVLRGEDTNHLIELEKQALAYGLPTYMVQDAGRTQVPAGSTTVLVIMGKVEVVDLVTGKLRLL